MWHNQRRGKCAAKAGYENLGIQTSISFCPMIEQNTKQKNNCTSPRRQLMATMMARVPVASGPGTEILSRSTNCSVNPVFGGVCNDSAPHSDT